MNSNHIALLVVYVLEIEVQSGSNGCLVCIAVATIICFSYGGSPTQLIFIANVLTSIAPPTATRLAAASAA